MMNTFGFLDLTTPELIITLVVVLLLVGTRKLPELSGGVRRSMRELRKGDDKDPVSKKVPKKTSQSK